jgi:hypothetical protein
MGRKAALSFAEAMILLTVAVGLGAALAYLTGKRVGIDHG